MRFLTLTLITCLLLMVGCKDGAQKEKTEDTIASGEHPQSTLDSIGTKKLINVVNSYYDLKDALVATKATQADSAAIKLSETIDSLYYHIKADSLNKVALQPYLDTIRNGSNQIIAAKDETTEKKRIPFEKVSDAMFGLLKTVEIKNVKVFRQYCPMALNDKGAYWLSNETEIRNPYFGKKMLECGEVTDSL